MQVTVVGAGVIGLVTAVELEARGHDVLVVAEATGAATTSGVAGAVWFPYRAGASERVPRWAARSLVRLRELAATEPDAGVDVLDVYECEHGEVGAAAPWWAEVLDAELTTAPVRGAPRAWRARAPRVEPGLFLPWLERRLARPVQRTRVDALAALPGDVVVHCAGLGARRLARDASLQAVYGHVVVVAPGTIPMELSITDDPPDAPIFYSIPRRAEVVLGGVALACADDHALAPRPADRERILARCAELGWTPGAVLREQTALRPARPELRLERDAGDPRVVHNYGHGGAGYTLAHGCAEAVAALLELDVGDQR